jgi:hypothetical protein
MAGENPKFALEKKVTRADGRAVVLQSPDPRELEALAMSNRGIGAELTAEDRKAFAGVMELQKEFQEKYCKSCVRYDPAIQDFLQKGHINDPSDCYWHWTNIIGECWNYKPRGPE